MESHSRGVGVSKRGEAAQKLGGDPRMKAKPLVSSGGPPKTCLGMAEGPPKMVWKAAHEGWGTPKIDVKLLASPKTGSKPLVRSRSTGCRTACKQQGTPKSSQTHLRTAGYPKNGVSPPPEHQRHPKMGSKLLLSGGDTPKWSPSPLQGTEVPQNGVQGPHEGQRHPRTGSKPLASGGGTPKWSPRLS